MSCEFNGILPAADQRWFVYGQCVLTPMWVGGHNESGLSDWQGEVIVGTVIDVQDEYDPAPDAEIRCWQTLIVEATVPGKSGARRFTRTNYNTVPLYGIK